MWRLLSCRQPLRSTRSPLFVAPMSSAKCFTPETSEGGGIREISDQAPTYTRLAFRSRAAERVLIQGMLLLSPRTSGGEEGGTRTSLGVAWNEAGWEQIRSLTRKVLRDHFFDILVRLGKGSVLQSSRTRARYRFIRGQVDSSAKRTPAASPGTRGEAIPHIAQARRLGQPASIHTD